MSFIIRNISGGQVVIGDLGLTLEIGQDYDLAFNESPNDIFGSQDLRDRINAGDVAALDPLDGVTQLSTLQSLEMVDRANAPNFRIFGGDLNQLDDVNTTSPLLSDVLTYSGSEWINSQILNGNSSGLIGDGQSSPADWTLVSGSIYEAEMAHNLGTSNVVITLYDITVSPVRIVLPNTIEIIDNNTMRVTIRGSSNLTKTLRWVAVANGSSLAAGGSTPSSVIIQDEGVNVPNTPHTILNFTGAAVDVTDAGGGAVNIDVIGSGGTVNSVDLTMPSEFAVSGNPVTSSGTLAVTKANQTANTVYSGPSAGGPTAPTFRALASADIPNLDWTKITTGKPTTLAGYGITDGVTQAERRFTYYPNSLDNPITANWVVNALAPVVADPSNSSFIVRQFNGTTEQGVGCFVTIPSGATNLTIIAHGRAQSAPGAGVIVQPRLYTRAIPNNAGVGSWSTANELANYSIPTNTNYVYYSQTVTLASLSLTANQMYQFEYTRRVAGLTGGTNLTGNWLLIELTFQFS